MYIGDLAKKDIGQMNIYSCEAGNVFTPNNVAQTFASTQQTKVYAFDGGVSYTNGVARPASIFASDQQAHILKYDQAAKGLLMYYPTKNGVSYKEVGQFSLWSYAYRLFNMTGP